MGKKSKSKKKRQQQQQNQQHLLPANGRIGAGQLRSPLSHSPLSYTPSQHHHQHHQQHHLPSNNAVGTSPNPNPGAKASLTEYTGSRTQYNATFRFLSPIVTSDELAERSDKLIRRLLLDPSIPYDGEGLGAAASSAWRVYARRANMYEERRHMGNGGYAHAVFPKVRPWWIAFVSVRPDDRPPQSRRGDGSKGEGSVDAVPIGGGQNPIVADRLKAHWFKATALVDPSSITNRRSVTPTDHPLTPNMILAALSKTIEDAGCKPRELILWPGLRGTWRPFSTKRMVGELHTKLSSMELNHILKVSSLDVFDFGDTLDSIKSSRMPHGTDRVCFPPTAKFDAETQLYVEPNGAVETLEGQLGRVAEERLRDVCTVANGAANGFGASNGVCAGAGAGAANAANGAIGANNKEGNNSVSTASYRPHLHPRSTLIPCISETVVPAGSLSTWELYHLFLAAKLFHDAKLWDVLGGATNDASQGPRGRSGNAQRGNGVTGWDYFTVRVPDVFVQANVSDHDDNAGYCGIATTGMRPVVDLETNRERTYIVMVNGHERWTNRGLMYYYTLEEMQRARRRRGGSNREGGGEAVRHSALRYFERTATPFKTLDHIAELDLPLPDRSSIPRIAPEEGYPSYFQNRLATTEDGGHIGARDFKEIWGRAPPRQDLASIALATLALVKFGTTTGGGGAPPGGAAVDGAAAAAENGTAVDGTAAEDGTAPSPVVGPMSFDLGIPGLDDRPAHVTAVPCSAPIPKVVQNGGGPANSFR